MSLITLSVALLVGIAVFAGNMFWGNTDWAILAAINVFVVFAGLLAVAELNLRMLISGLSWLFRREWALGLAALLLLPVANALLLAAFMAGSYVAELLNLHQFEGPITIQDHLSGKVAALNSLRCLPVVVAALAMLPFLQNIGRHRRRV